MQEALRILEVHSTVNYTASRGLIVIKWFGLGSNLLKSYIFLYFSLLEGFSGGSKSEFRLIILILTAKSKRNKISPFKLNII